MVKDPSCKNRNWKLPDLDNIVGKMVRRVALDKQYFHQLINKNKFAHAKKPQGEQGIIQRKIAELDKQIGKLMDLYQLDSIPVETVSERIEALHKEKIALRERLSSMPESFVSDFNLEGIKSLLQDISLVWDNADIEQK